MEEGKVSKEEQERLQKRRDEKNEETKQAREDTEKLREQKFKEGEEDFEDFIAGKKKQQDIDIKSQFTALYMKAKESN